ncbi:MAG: leucine--tRNA ligase [Bacteroidetes bacterium]|nr:leucine--tRNA ligase [Bacteroidota bacterium]
MEYDFRTVEDKWRKFWAKNQTNKIGEDFDKPKFYVLDMFPYPSGAGLHVGHPLGYIASDIYARYKKLQGFNVLHPMGYDSFGLPAEQYAIQTGQHPALTTEQNIARYRDQLDKIGFCFDWSREVRTSSPEYYKWTQQIFIKLFNSWYNPKNNRAEHIDTLISIFENEGSKGVTLEILTGEIEKEVLPFSAAEWKSFDERKQREILMHFRLAYLGESFVNWCPAMGTVLANDEVVNGVSERGGHPIERKLMKQWSMRITAFAQRLLDGLNDIDWSESIKETQRNWIGRSEGCSIFFPFLKEFTPKDTSSMGENSSKIEVFTTRPDTVFGVSFVTLAPEHELVDKITTNEQRQEVETYVEKAKNRSERERQADVNTISGVFTGAYLEHPFTKEPIQVWVGDYVLVGYGTGAVMAVPAHDERDYKFAKHFGLPIKQVINPSNPEHSMEQEAWTEKEGEVINSDFLNGLQVKIAIKRAIEEIEKNYFGRGRVNYRLRDAVFGRQRYWGEPIPIYYKDEVPYALNYDDLPLNLPEVDKYLPTEDGEPPLARAINWKYQNEYNYEFSTMPGWAGSSWYFLRYLDPKNPNDLFSQEKVNYWKNVDLYIGGSEHATGHLLYARFWTKFLFDRGIIPFDEPFKKMINQGMILGRSSFVYLVIGENKFVTNSIKDHFKHAAIHVDISLIDNDKLNINEFRKWRPEYAEAEFICEEDGSYVCGYEVEKMSKSKYNVQTPDELVDKFGADTLRMYEMFLGPLEQTKPWDTKGITGVNGFLRKFWRLLHPTENIFSVSNELGHEKEMRVLHKTIKRIREDLDRYSFNTCISTFMIAINELTDLKCNKKAVLEPLVVLIAPFAPHFSEELWEKLGNQAGTVTNQSYPEYDETFLIESNFDYPISFNGKMRTKVNLSLQLTAKEVETYVLQLDEIQKWMENKSPKKVIVVPGKIVNIVL